MFIDRTRTPIFKGKQLGTGGEGSVFEVNGMPGKVLKLYHKSLTSEHTAKLRSLVTVNCRALEQVAAFPSELVSDIQGRMIGFLMPFVDERPFHELYNTVERRKSYPQATYQFIVFVARNIAAAFDTLHQHGIVVGDVNQNNVLFHPQHGTVRFVDCDSFQLRHGSVTHRCLVGVDHFTPPELQQKSFKSVDRTVNHDAFGMAVLIFHLLTLGRHLFAGIYRGPGEMPSIADNIKHCRFPFALNPPPLFVPPPNSLSLKHQPPGIARFFTDAFSSSSAHGQSARPSAGEWGHELELMRSTLQQCDVDESHFSPSAYGRCLWCELETSCGISAFASHVAIGNVDELERIVLQLHNQIAQALMPRYSWDAVLQRTPLPRVTASDVVVPKFAPDPAQLALCRLVSYAIVVTSLASTLFLWSAIVFPILGLFTAALLINFLLIRNSVAPTVIHEIRRNERKADAAMVSAIEGQRHLFEDQPRKASTLRARASQLWQSWDRYSKDEAENVRKQKQNRQQTKLNAYLASVPIARDRAFGITNNMGTKLGYFGIHTAADFLTEQQLCQVDGIGPRSAEKLLAWKKFVIQSFRPSAQYAASLDQQTLHTRRAALRSLQHSSMEIQSESQVLGRQLSQCAENVHTALLSPMQNKQSSALISRLYTEQVTAAAKSGKYPRIRAPLLGSLWGVNVIAFMLWTIAASMTSPKPIDGRQEHAAVTQNAATAKAASSDTPKLTEEPLQIKDAHASGSTDLTRVDREKMPTPMAESIEVPAVLAEKGVGVTVPKPLPAGVRDWYVNLFETQKGTFIGRKNGGILIRLLNDAIREIKAEDIADEDEFYLRMVEFRQWRSKDNKFITNARMLKHDDVTVELEFEDGRRKPIPIDRLNENDQEWIASPLYKIVLQPHQTQQSK